MRIKLDENVPPSLKGTLIKYGHDVCTTLDEGLLSQPDTRISEAAIAEDRMLFTLDLEFADLRKYPPGKHTGVILFRPHSMGMGTVADYISKFVAGIHLEDFTACVVIVDPDRVRVRRPPLDFDSPEWKTIPIDDE